MKSDIERCWFAVRTKPRQELIARDQLQHQGFEAYLPLVNTRITHARKVSWQPRPFFAGYLFLHLSKEEQRWTTIRSTIGVLAPVRFGDFFPSLPDQAIELLQQRHDDAGFISLTQNPAEPFASGESIRMLSGSLQGLEGVFVEMKGSDRALILLDWMQKRIRVEADVDSIESAT